MIPDAPFPRLLADIGGTNARFAWRSQTGAALAQVRSYRCADHASLQDAAVRYLDETGLPRPSAAAFGIATSISGDTVRMTNHHWQFSVSGLRRALGVDRCLVLNDFAALAHAIAHLSADALHPVGGRPGDRGARAVLGPGTGLGVAGLVRGPGDRWIVLEGEGGHVTLPAQTDEEWAIICQLSRRYGHVSAERILSGPGLVACYQALCAVRGLPARDLSAAGVTAGADSDPVCSDTVDMFLALLGSVAGNVALTLGARGGVYLGGGIVPRLLERLGRSAFRRRFEDKGRFSDYLAAIPVWVIDPACNAGLIGADAALDQSP